MCRMRKHEEEVIQRIKSDMASHVYWSIDLHAICRTTESRHSHFICVSFSRAFNLSQCFGCFFVAKNNKTAFNAFREIKKAKTKLVTTLAFAYNTQHISNRILQMETLAKTLYKALSNWIFRKKKTKKKSNERFNAIAYSIIAFHYTQTHWMKRKRQKKQQSHMI